MSNVIRKCENDKWKNENDERMNKNTRQMMSILGKIFVSLKSDDEAGVIVKAAARIARTAAITHQPAF